MYIDMFILSLTQSVNGFVTLSYEELRFIVNTCNIFAVFSLQDHSTGYT